MTTADISQQFIAHLWRGGVWGYIWTSDGPERVSKDGTPYRAKITRWQPATRPIAIPTAWGDKNVYFCVNPCSEIPTTNDEGSPRKPHQVRGRMPHVAAINCLFAEFDIKPEQYASQAAIMAQLERLPVFPTVLIHSGGGIHGYWLLEHTVMLDDTNREHYRQLQAAWVKFAHGDEVKDLTRVLRVPGTRNMKGHFSPNFPTVTILEHDFRRLFTPAHFEQATAPMLAAMQEAARRAREEAASRVGTAGGAAERLLNWAVAHTNQGGRHNMSLWLAAKLKQEGLAQWTIAANLKEFASRVNHDTGRRIDDSEMERVARWAGVNT